MIRAYLPSLLSGAATSGVMTVSGTLLVRLLTGSFPNLFWIAVFFFSGWMISSFMYERLGFRKLRELQARSDDEIRKLKDNETFRREFLGDVSHELKTPIFAIEGFIETLLHGGMEDEKVNRRFLQKALTHAERLSTLVQDLLIITQVESGELGMHIERFNLNDLIRETVESLEPKFHQNRRNILCIVQMNRLERLHVMADRERIRQVLINLVDNAVKYGDIKGIVTLSVERFPEDKVKVSVRDNGPGITAEHLPRLFERFYRVDKSRSRDSGGTGLGLAICKHMIEAHKEKIWVDSTVGEGTTFSFTLRLSPES